MALDYKTIVALWKNSVASSGKGISEAGQAYFAYYCEKTVEALNAKTPPYITNIALYIQQQNNGDLATIKEGVALALSYIVQQYPEVKPNPSNPMAMYDSIQDAIALAKANIALMKMMTSGEITIDSPLDILPVTLEDVKKAKEQIQTGSSDVTLQSIIANSQTWIVIGAVLLMLILSRILKSKFKK